MKILSRHRIPNGRAAVTVSRESFSGDSSQKLVVVGLSVRHGVGVARIHDPSLIWCRIPAHSGVRTLEKLTLAGSRLGVYRAVEFCFEWSLGVTSLTWEQIPDFVEGLVPEPGVKAAAEAFRDAVKAEVREIWARDHVQAACSILPPSRVSEMAGDVAVKQVMEA